MTLHNVESSEGFNMALKKVRGKKKKEKEKKKLLQHRIFIFGHRSKYSYLVTHPSTNPAEQLNFVERTRHGTVLVV